MSREISDPGGKGVNVAKVIKALGLEVTVTGFLGKENVTFFYLPLMFVINGWRWVYIRLFWDNNTSNRNTVKEQAMVKVWRKNKFQRDEKQATGLKTDEPTESSVRPTESRLIRTADRDLSQLLRGSKLRFTEDVRFNLHLIKFLVPAADLAVENFMIGSSASKEVILVYLRNIANPGIVAEVKKRVKAIRARTLTDSSYIQRNIEDAALSPFPQVETTQRPDIAESALWQGRVAIILNGSPDVLLAPCTFFELLDTPEDAYSRWFFAVSFFKIARYIMLLSALCLPGFYIALLSYNPQLIPTRLLLMLISSREGASLPVYFEAFLMMGVVEAIRMMMIRMPSQLGSAIALFSGVALVIAGLSSHIIGASAVMITTLTVIASFGIPDYDLRSAIRIFQFFTMIMSSFLGLFGFAVSFFMICIHLVNLKSFGIPYMAPLAPVEPSGWRHTIVRGNSKEMPIDETYKPQNTPESRADND